VAGFLLYHTVRSRSYRSSTRLIPIVRVCMWVLQRGTACLSGFAGVHCCDAAVLWLFLFALYNAKTSSNPPHPSHVLCHLSPVARASRRAAFAAAKLSGTIFFNFYASSKPKGIHVHTTWYVFAQNTRDVYTYVRHVHTYTRYVHTSHEYQVCIY